MTDWSGALIEDYLNIFEDSFIIASSLDDANDSIVVIENEITVIQENINYFLSISNANKNRVKINQLQEFGERLQGLLYSLKAASNKNRVRPVRVRNRTACDVVNPASPVYRALNTAYQNNTGGVLRVYLTAELSE